MAKKSPTNFFKIEYCEWDEQEPYRVQIDNDPDIEPEVIECTNSMDIKDAMSAITAYGDSIKFGIYSRVDARGKMMSEPGLHFYANGGPLNGFRGTNLAVVSTDYTGSFPVPVPHIDEYPNGWAQVNMRRGKFYLSHFSKSSEVVRSRKHDFVDLWLMGVPVLVRVYPFNQNKDEDGLGWFDKVLRTWMEPDATKAAELREMGIAKASNSRKVYEAGKRAANMPSKPITTRRGQVNGAVEIVTNTGEIVNVGNLPHCTILGVDKRGNRFTFQLDGTAPRLAEVARAADLGYTFVLPE